MQNVKAIQKLNELEIAQNLTDSASWHSQYKHSAYVYAGGLPFTLTEGDVICIFSQWGEIVDVNLVRDKETGKSKGFAFIAYEDQRSTVLAVDNFNGTMILGRTIRVDHVQNYRGEKVKDNETPEQREERLRREQEKLNAVLPRHLKDPSGRVSESEDDDSEDEDSEAGLDEGEKTARRRQREADAEDPMREFLTKKKPKKDKKDKKDKKEKKEKKKKDKDKKSRRHDREYDSRHSVRR